MVGPMSALQFARYMDEWVRWMRGSTFRSLRKLWYPGRSRAFVAVPDGTDMELETRADLEDLERDCDAALALCIDGLVNSLEPIESCAVHNRYLASVFRFARVDMDEVIERAEAKIARGLLARGFP